MPTLPTTGPHGRSRETPRRWRGVHRAQTSTPRPPAPHPGRGGDDRRGLQEALPHRGTLPGPSPTPRTTNPAPSASRQSPGSTRSPSTSRTNGIGRDEPLFATTAGTPLPRNTFRTRIWLPAVGVYRQPGAVMCPPHTPLMPDSGTTGKVEVTSHNYRLFPEARARPTSPLSTPRARETPESGAVQAASRTATCGRRMLPVGKLTIARSRPRHPRSGRSKTFSAEKAVCTR